MKGMTWKAPKGAGWSKTINIEIAVKNATSKVHAVVTDATGDVYYYK